MTRQTRVSYILMAFGAAACGGVVFLLQAAGLVNGDPVAVVTSALLFASLFLFQAGLFSQGGDIRLSAQREAAIATGHMDRTTLFEQPLLRPLLWLLLAISHRMAMAKAKEWLRRTLVSAGSPNFYTAEEYLALSFFTGCIVGAVMVFINFLARGQISIVFFIVGLILGTLGAVYQLYDKAATRLRLISRRVPYALDLISLAMGAGATFTEAAQTVVREQGEDPFNVELRTMLSEMDLGATRRKALLNLSDRVPLDGLRSIIAAVVQAEELGTPLGQVLHDQASLMRLQRSVRAENLAAVASVRILVPCLLLVMAVIVLVFGPFMLHGLGGGLF